MSLQRYPYTYRCSAEKLTTHFSLAVRHSVLDQQTPGILQFVLEQFGVNRNVRSRHRTYGLHFLELFHGPPLLLPLRCCITVLRHWHHKWRHSCAVGSLDKRVRSHNVAAEDPPDFAIRDCHFFYASSA